MTKTFCDNCGDQITPKNEVKSPLQGIGYIAEIRVSEELSGGRADLCRECLGKFVASGANRMDVVRVGNA